MDRIEIMLLAGIITAIIWMGVCLVMEGKNRKYIIMIGIMIDIVLFIICKNCEMLFVGILGGFLCGLVPGFGDLRKYELAIREMKGVKNWTVVSIIFFVMIFMTIAIAYPGLTIKLR